MIDGNQNKKFANIIKTTESEVLNKPVFSIDKSENFDIEKIKLISEKYNFINKKKEIENLVKTNLTENIFINNDNDLFLNLVSTKPEKKNDKWLNLNISESYEVNVDLLNFVSQSGGMEKINLNVIKKN